MRRHDVNSGAVSTASDSFVEKAECFYARHLQAVLEPEQTGRFIAIETETGRCFIGGTGTDALVVAHAAMPESLFYLKRIGYEYADRLGGRFSN